MQIVFMLAHLEQLDKMTYEVIDHLLLHLLDPASWTGFPW